VRELNKAIAQLQDKLQEKTAQLSASQAEVVRYRGLCDQYQGQLAKVEAQAEVAIPRSYELVEEKAVQPLVLEMRLRLQAKGCAKPQDLVFPQFKGDAEVTIKQLKAALEAAFSLKDQKALQLARYLIESRDPRPTKYSETLAASQ
jgi:hypothetical protein